MQEDQVPKTFKHLRKINVFGGSRPSGKAQHEAKMGPNEAKMNQDSSRLPKLKARRSVIKDLQKPKEN